MWIYIFFFRRFIEGSDVEEISYKWRKLGDQEIPFIFEFSCDNDIDI